MTDRTRIALAAAAAFCLAGCISLDGFLFDSSRRELEDYDFGDEELDGIDPQRITSVLIPSAEPGVKIHVVYAERDPAELDPRIDPQRRVSVLFSHGNRGNIGLYWYRAGYFEDMGFNVMFYDYRGYGASGGQTSERHIYEDVATAHDWLEQRDEVGDIVSVGYSMGGAPAIRLCSIDSGREPLACFTESTFTATEGIVHDATGFDLPGDWLVDSELDNLARIARVEVPFLLMHGTEDHRVPFWHGRDLWEEVRDNHPLNRFYPVGGATHRNVPLPSYRGEEEPREYSHPDELPAELRDELDLYQRRIADFVVDALAELP